MTAGTLPSYSHRQQAHSLPTATHNRHTPFPQPHSLPTTTNNRHIPFPQPQTTGTLPSHSHRQQAHSLPTARQQAHPLPTATLPSHSHRQQAHSLPTATLPSHKHTPFPQPQTIMPPSRLRRPHTDFRRADGSDAGLRRLGLAAGWALRLRHLLPGTVVLHTLHCTRAHTFATGQRTLEREHRSASV